MAATSSTTAGHSVAGATVRLKVSRGADAPAWQPYPGMSVAQATQAAQRAGWRVMEADAPQPLPGTPGEHRAPWLARMVQSGGASRFDLLLFSQEMLTLLQAGLNLGEALDTLHAKSKAGAERQTLARIIESVQQGRAFSDVLAAQPAEFPEVYVATIRASERTGNLPQALERFIAYQQQFDTLRRKLVSAAIYPAMLLVVGAFVVLFLLGFVVPRFAAVYESSGRDMPVLSQALLLAGRLVHDHTALVLGTLLACCVALALSLRAEATRQRLLDAVLSLPGLRERTALFRLGRFYRALGLLLASGIALPRAMGMVSGLLGPAQRASLAQARLQLEQGKPVSQTLVANGLASAVAESLVKVGERSGQLADMLERTARFHDEELSRWIDAASRLLEPLLMLLIGLVIGVVVVLMYLPIFDLAGAL